MPCQFSVYLLRGAIVVCHDAERGVLPIMMRHAILVRSVARSVLWRTPDAAVSRLHALRAHGMLELSSVPNSRRLVVAR